MNSLIANLFLAIQTKIAAIQDTDGNPVIKHIDQDLGQMEDHDGNNRPPVLFPCVLIDIDDIAYKALSGNVQTGKGKIIIRLGHTPYSGSSAAVPTDYKQRAIEFYDTEYALHQALQGFAPFDADVFGGLDRVSAVTEKRRDFIRVRQIVYTLSFEDYTVATPFVMQAAAPVVTDQILPQ